ncbi:MarR family transcriptional regulator [Saccharopolyspora taberi]|uniref:MarR family transcriptional regulator n=1 Tax=Saccharopolyspora taberi TaxID=60895 RepID=A0ABN3VLQ4_9PSEU
MSDIDDPRLTASGLLMEAHDGLVRKLLPGLAAHGLARPDFNVLIRLARSPGGRLRMSDLAAQTALSTSGITRVVDRLEARGFADRESRPDDRRSTYAVVTAEGRKVLERFLPDHLAEIDRWLTGLLTPEQLDALLEALRTVRDEVFPEATSH